MWNLESTWNRDGGKNLNHDLIRNQQYSKAKRISVQRHGWDFDSRLMHESNILPCGARISCSSYAGCHACIVTYVHLCGRSLAKNQKILDLRHCGSNEGGFANIWLVTIKVSACPKRSYRGRQITAEAQSLHILERRILYHWKGDKNQSYVGGFTYLKHRNLLPQVKCMYLSEWGKS